MSDTEWHKRFAVDCYNGAWELMDLPARAHAQDLDLVALACAQRFHWYAVGSEDNKAIADWQVARALSFIGEGPLAIRFAERAVEIAETLSEPDFLRASCYEGLARAHAVAGNQSERDTWLARAREALTSIAEDDDREEIARQIDSVPTARGVGSVPS
jgi:hypothetical protein